MPARAVAAFDYGAVYEQAISRWHHAEALLASGTEAETQEAAGELLLVFEVTDATRGFRVASDQL